MLAAPTRPPPPIRAPLRDAPRRRARALRGRRRGADRRLDLRLHEPQPLDAATLAFYADAWLPPVFSRARRAARGAHDRPHDPLPRRRPPRRPSPPTSRSSASSAPTTPRTASSRSPTASCGRPTASCSRTRASSMLLLPWTPRVTGYLGLGSNVGDRRALLQAAVDALPRPRRARRCVVVDVRHRPGRRRARSAAVPQRVRAHRDRPGPRGAARRLQGRRARAGPRAAGRRGLRPKGPRPIDVDLLLLGDVDARAPSG